MKLKRSLACTLCVLLLASLFSGCADDGPDVSTQEPGQTDNGDSPSAGDAVNIAYAGDYADVYGAIQASLSTDTDEALRGGGELDVMGMESAADLADDSSAVTSAAASDYSGTNVQVSGVDEGDVVKTDGEYIYILRDRELIIAGAAGEGTAVLSRTALFDSEGSEWAVELYLYDRYVAVVTGFYQWIDDGDSGVQDINRSGIHLYDVSDPAAPQYVTYLGQDGNYLSSRLAGGTLYLLSHYYVYGAREEDEATYIPAVYRESAATLVEPNRIAIAPGTSYAAAHTVIAAYDLESGTQADYLSVLGGGSTVYMNLDNLFLANASYAEQVGEPYAEDQYTVTEHTGGSQTDLLRFSLAGGGISLAASGSVPGYLNGQFALDEYDGHLRLVTTVNASSWTEYLDEERGWINSVWGENRTANALYVLDSDLGIVGSVEDLAPDEMVYSVRFDGEIGYFVTFRQVDPLFAVDLSDPNAPEVLSALKIPGFSEYLHPFDTDRLFGLGMDADEDTGVTGGMKLSMFDTGDPRDVTEKHTLILESNYSVALYNHRAILISAEKDLIAFPADTGYAVYGYSDELGFYLRAGIDCDSTHWNYNTRGLYIGLELYVVSDTAIQVFDMENFAELTVISL